MTATTLAEDLLLVAYDDETGRSHAGSTELNCGLAGALLVDLALAGRIDVADGRVVVLDDTPLGQPEADAALERIAAEGRAHKPDWWVGKLRSGVRARILDRLAGRGLLREQRSRILWIFPTRRYPAVDGSAEAVVRTRLQRIVTDGAPPDERTAALAALLQACGLARRTFPELDRGQRKALRGHLGERRGAPRDRLDQRRRDRGDHRGHGRDDVELVQPAGSSARYPPDDRACLAASAARILVVRVRSARAARCASAAENRRTCGWMYY